MMIRKVDHLRIVKSALGHDLCVPVGRPTFVQDLGLSLGCEVVRLFANHPEDVALPVGQRSIFGEEQHDVLLLLFGKTLPSLALIFEFLPLLFHEFPWVDEIIHVFTGCDLPDHDGFFGRFLRLAFSFDEHRVVIDKVVDGETDINKAFHLLQPILVDMFADLGGVVRHDIHHFAIRLGKPDIVLEEIAVPIHVRHDDFLIDQMIAFQQVGVARVVVDDHFIDLVQAVGVTLVEAFVLHAELPVGIAIGETAVGGHHVHLFKIENLEESFVEVESVLARVLLDLPIESRKLRCKGRSAALNGHGYDYLPFPRKSLMD